MSKRKQAFDNGFTSNKKLKAVESVLSVLGSLTPDEIRQINNATQRKLKVDFITKFSDELSIEIIKRFCLKDVYIAQKVSKEWYRLCNDSMIWKNMYKSKYTVLPCYLQGTNRWKDAYKFQIIPDSVKEEGTKQLLKYRRQYQSHESRLQIYGVCVSDDSLYTIRQQESLMNDTTNYITYDIIRYKDELIEDLLTIKTLNNKIMISVVPDNSRLAICYSSEIEVWNFLTEKLDYTIKTLRTSQIFCKGEMWIVKSSDRKNIFLYDIKNGNQIGDPITIPHEKLGDIDVEHNRLAVALEYDRGVEIINLDTRETVHRVAKNTFTIFDKDHFWIKFDKIDPDCIYLTSINGMYIQFPNNGNLLFDNKDKQEIYSYVNNNKIIHGSKKVYVYDLQKGTNTLILKNKYPSKIKQELYFNKKSFYIVNYHKDTNLVEVEVYSLEETLS